MVIFVIFVQCRSAFCLIFAWIGYLEFLGFLLPLMFLSCSRTALSLWLHHFFCFHLVVRSDSYDFTLRKGCFPLDHLSCFLKGKVGRGSIVRCRFFPWVICVALSNSKCLRCVGNANAPFLLGLYNVHTSPVALGGRWSFQAIMSSAVWEREPVEELLVVVTRVVFLTSFIFISLVYWVCVAFMYWHLCFVIKAYVYTSSCSWLCTVACHNL